MLTLTDDRTPEQAKRLTAAALTASDPATVTILSGEETPTVTFSTESISIDEGESESVHLLASGMQGDEVDSVTVSGAWRGQHFAGAERQRDLGRCGVVRRQRQRGADDQSAVSDPSLEDGEEKTATVTITDAGGANIGNPSSVTVTVVGSTAVPVLPLFAQLLLALLLMVGGARLYRRRQG